MPFQIITNGEIEPGDDFTQYSELDLLKAALQLNNWNIDSHSSFSGGYNTFTISNGGIILNLHIYLKKIMWRHRSDYEKGIQFPADRIADGYNALQTDSTKTVMLGIYKTDKVDDFLIAAWDPFEWGNLGKACNCFIDVRALSLAYQIGLTADSSKLPRKVFAFRPEFLHYYLINKVQLHINQVPNLDGLNYENDIQEDLDDVFNFEQLYKDWLINKYGENSGTVNSYMLSIRKISEIISKNIFEENNTTILLQLLAEVKENQSVEGSKFYITDAPSYSTKGFLSASLSNYITFLEDLKEKSNHTGKNTIYYGAPGTGKSYKVDEKIKNLNPKFYERITFHPEFDNASFVGGYKPISEKKEDGEEIINYKFVPQAFASIYTKAWKDLDNDYYLVIEEINRGNCAEIFGEIFQLLDRNSNYSVTPSKELKEHIIQKLDNNKEHDGIIKGLKLPPNLHILATMNTSDQSLFPMDSAFKRRWEWEYVPICYEVQNEEGKDNLSFNFEIDLGDGTKYRWIDFIAKINNSHIKNNLALGMDKCIGNYFIKPTTGNSIELKPFINKVIFYLWNDVFKDEDNKVFENKGSYEDFFPIATNGLSKVKELFARIELSPIPAYPVREEEVQLDQVAEENQPLA